MASREKRQEEKLVFATRCGGICVIGCLMLLSSCRPIAVGPTVPSGYRVIVPAASQTTRRRPLPLTVRVIDITGAAADGVAVHFRIADADAALADIVPPTVRTQHGEATAVLYARAAGRVTVEITVESVTATTHIDIFGASPRF